MSVEANRALVRRFVEEIFNRGNFEGVSEILAPDYVSHDPTTEEFGPGVEGLRQSLEVYRRAFPDYRIELEDQIAADDKVVDRWTGYGTHRGELRGIAPTGRQVSAAGISIHRIADGRIVETWNNYDVLGMLRQIQEVLEPHGTKGA